MSRAEPSTSLSAKLKKIFYRFAHYPPQAAYALGLGPKMGRMILLLATTGRKSGKRRVTPLQYEEVDGKIIVMAAYGLKADWVKNIQANPCVDVQVKEHHFSGQALLITDAEKLADMLELRLQRHPRMIGAILRSDGVPANPSRQDLVDYAKGLAMVELMPEA